MRFHSKTDQRQLDSEFFPDAYFISMWKFYEFRPTQIKENRLYKNLPQESAREFIVRPILNTGKLTLVYNHFPNYVISNHIRQFLSKVTTSNTVHTVKNNNINIFNKTPKQVNYKQDGISHRIVIRKYTTRVEQKKKNIHFKKFKTRL